MRQAAFLSVIAGLPSRLIPLAEGAWTLGRTAGTDFEFAHPEVSRQHCRLTWDGLTCVLEDLGSARGTSVNGVKISAPTPLAPGAKIGLGAVTLEFDLGNAAAPRSAVPVHSGSAGIPMVVRGEVSERLEVDRELIIGREPGTEVWLNDAAVSRRHAKVAPAAGGGCIVTDLRSTAGSFVNGHRFDSYELTVGDRLQIGPFFFQFDGHGLNRVSNTSGGALAVEAVFVRSETLTILDNITVQIPASRFVGIIGPSGAGKSSLLRVISGMSAPTEGVVLLEGEDLYGSDKRRSIGFVPQEDIVHPELTVAEALRYSARLRLPAGTPPLELHKLVLQTMDQLGLREHALKLILHLSGGQRKRVSVGAELLAKPAVLFLDEPSSGLDPATEFQLMELLRDLADTGCTIVCTTHVMENAFLMDQLIVMAGGCVAFQGSAAEVRTYFGVSKLTALYDQLLERPAKQWQSAFQERAQAAEPPAALHLPARSQKPQRRAFALPILLARQWAILRSDKQNFLILAGQPLIIAALVCWVTDERARVMFFAYIATLWFGCSNAAQRIVEELAIYRRERLVGVGAHAYLASKFLFLSAITALQALLLFAAALLFGGGLDGSVPWQIAALLGTAVAGVGMGCAISALARTAMQAVMIVPLLLIPLIIFSGYTVPPKEMRPSVLLVSRLTPTFSAQVVFDTSFLWHRPMAGKLMEDHGQSLRNLDPNSELETNEIYARSRPAVLALLGHGLWLISTYGVAWAALKRRAG